MWNLPQTAVWVGHSVSLTRTRMTEAIPDGVIYMQAMFQTPAA